MNRKYEFVLPLLNIVQEMLEIPEQKIENVVHFDSKTFYKVCKNLQDTSEHIIIGLEKGDLDFKLLFYSNGLEFKTRFTYCKEEGMYSEIDYIQIANSIKATYKLKYLLLISKVCFTSDLIQLYLGQEVPLKCTYIMPEIGQVSYYLAPCIEDD